MAQILAPSIQCQMGAISNNSLMAKPMTARMWGSLLMNNQRLRTKSSAKFRVFAIKSENSTVSRLDDLLNLDVTPYTDKIIAEYIW